MRNPIKTPTSNSRYLKVQSSQMQDNQGSEFLPHDIIWDEQKAKRMWDYYGHSNAHRSTYFGESVGDHFVRTIKRRGVFQNAHTIVDFACGTGAVMAAILKIAPKGASVQGYDPSQKSVDEANNRNRGVYGFSGAHQFEGYPTNLQSKSVDLLILTEVIEHLDDHTLQSVLEESTRVLAPNGNLVATTPNSENLEASNVICPECGCIFHRWQHQRSWTTTELRDEFARHGFQRIQLRQITWGNELIDLATTVLRMKKTGILVIAAKN